MTGDDVHETRRSIRISAKQSHVAPIWFTSTERGRSWRWVNHGHLSSIMMIHGSLVFLSVTKERRYHYSWRHNESSIEPIVILIITKQLANASRISGTEHSTMIHRVRIHFSARYDHSPSSLLIFRPLSFNLRFPLLWINIYWHHVEIKYFQKIEYKKKERVWAKWNEVELSEASIIIDCD